MNRSICKTMPEKNDTYSLQTVNFVYETEFKKMKQPFNRKLNYIHIVSKGAGILKYNSKEYNLTTASLFFSFPSVPYEIEATSDFEYIYISYTGRMADSITEKLNISDCVYHNLDNVLEFWKETIHRITPDNANILAECALYYALSYINNPPRKSSSNTFDEIISYIDKNFTCHDITLKKVAGIFSYTEKYLSSLFRKNMEVTFTSYLNSLRIGYALKLMENNETCVADIANKSGFSDALYFSKVFKKSLGAAPSEKIKQIKKKNKL